jgi:hypothetical protein
MSDITNRGESAPAKSQLDTFLEEVKQLASGGGGGRGRIIFALDATASREATWDTACKLQAEMFQEAATVGSLDMQLVYYRGLNECRASHWLSDAGQLGKTMSQIMCRAGETQLEKVLIHAAKETKLLKVSALAFVGDALEESPDIVLGAASTLGRLSVPVFMFQEGRDRLVEQTFQDIAQLTHGAYCRFDPGAARQLAELLRAVAVYAVGGMPALAAHDNASAAKLLSQLR